MSLLVAVRAELVQSGGKQHGGFQMSEFTASIP